MYAVGASVSRSQPESTVTFTGPNGLKLKMSRQDYRVWRVLKCWIRTEQVTSPMPDPLLGYLMTFVKDRINLVYGKQTFEDKQRQLRFNYQKKMLLEKLWDRPMLEEVKLQRIHFTLEEVHRREHQTQQIKNHLNQFLKLRSQ